jgi:glycosyltransferase involved in cell wall biosynthesis
MKIAWICHFSNSEIQDIIKPYRRVHAYAPWITNTARLFENQQQHELNVISPHRFIAGSKSFVLRGVRYHFFNPGIPGWGRQWPPFFRFDLITSYRHNSKMIHKFIDSINPDVIHLQGAENPYYSSSIFKLRDRFPIVVNLQRMDPEFRFGNTAEARKRKTVEMAIVKGFKNFSIRTDTMRNDLLKVNPTAKTYWVPYNIPQPVPFKGPKEYDLVYFARVSKQKGIEDLIQAAALLTPDFPNLTLCVIGGVNQNYREYLDGLALAGGVKIIWKGLLPEIEDVHREACKARISVLPTHQDIIPGTIVESMQLGLPVVSYKVGSIPELNAETESVLLVEKGGIVGLADNIRRLLSDTEYADQLAKTAKRTIDKFISAHNVLDKHLSCYEDVIGEYQTQIKSNV